MIRTSLVDQTGVPSACLSAFSHRLKSGIINVSKTGRESLSKNVKLTLVSCLRQNSGDVEARDQVEERKLDASFHCRPGKLLVACSLEARCPGNGNLVMVRLQPEGPRVGLVRPVRDHEEAGKTQSDCHDGVDDEQPSIEKRIRRVQGKWRGVFPTSSQPCRDDCPLLI